MEIVRIEGGSLFLFSGLKQESFARTNFSEFLKEKNLLVKIENGNISSEEYKFSKTKSDAQGLIFFEGDGKFLPNGKLLSEILSENLDGDEKIVSLESYFLAVDFLFQSDKAKEFGKSGGGVIISADSATKTAGILFLNPEFFELSAQNHRELYPTIQGKFLYKGLDSPSSLLFSRAVASYKAITNFFPYDENDTTKRQEDIFDQNFIPISLYNEKIDKNLSESIDSALSLRIPRLMTAGMKNLSDKKQETKRKKILESAMQFDSELFMKNFLEKKDSSKELAEKRQKFSQKKKKIISTKRFFRRNKTRIFAGIAAIIVVLWFINGYVEQNGRLATTRGLSSRQTTALLYTMIHSLDVPNAQEIVQGSETRDLLVKLSGYYVSSKQRLETNPNNGTVTPEKWFYEPKSSKNWMFGITNLKIDGEKTDFYANFPTKKENPKPISAENEKILKNGDEIFHLAEYYFVRQAETKIFVDKMTDKITLRWSGKQWKVVKIEGKSKTASHSTKDFKNEYFEILRQTSENFAKNDGGTIEKNAAEKSLEILRNKYEWIPNY